MIFKITQDQFLTFQKIYLLALADRMRNGWRRNKAESMDEDPVNIFKESEVFEISPVNKEMDWWVTELLMLRGLSFHQFNLNKMTISQKSLIEKALFFRIIRIWFIKTLKLEMTLNSWTRISVKNKFLLKIFILNKVNKKLRFHQAAYNFNFQKQVYSKMTFLKIIK